MKFVSLLLTAFLVGIASTAPISDDDTLTITDEFFPNELAVYTSEHDIVSLTVPLNAINFGDDDDDSEDENIVVFFVEADVNSDGKKDYKGLYALKNGVATKLLETGTDASAANDDSSDAFFGASDGIYKYNAKENKAEKYGTVDDFVINIVKENGTDVIYILTANNELYKVSDDGNKKVKIDEVKDAQQIVLDYSNNLYYYGVDKQPYVVNEDGVKKIEGLPANPTSVNLVKPPFVLEDAVLFLSDDILYIAYLNGTSEKADMTLSVKPSAYAPEATLIQYYAYNKKIYEYNILALVLGELLEELKSALEEKLETIQSIATRSRADFGRVHKRSVRLYS